ncbi:MAG TPA: carboxylesterase family protein [Bacteroidales bacterium]|nr:carboxylesterase family protein [Bacteroidales bacterium]
MYEIQSHAMQGNGSPSDSTMNEQKLFTVNVWSQGLNDGKKRPVMLWIHGGGFASGSSNDPVSYGEMLAKKGDIVLVSVNHRLNILGFLDLSEYGAKYASSANVGMLDLVESLRWINKNIKEFGGDPSNVTIFGESGGGGKVATLLCMPAAKGLFHKAIIQSGTLLNVMTKEKSTLITRALLKELGLSAAQVSSLDTIPYRKLVEAGNKALTKTVGMRTPGTAKMFGFGPVPDGVNLLQQPFSPSFSEISKDVPVLIGTTFNELRRTVYGEKNLTMEQARERLVKGYGEKAEKYIELFGKSYPGYSPQDLLSIDTVFRPYTIMVADAWSAKSKAPVYTYMLTWKSPIENGTRGSFHGLDIALVFNNVSLGQMQWTGKGEDAYALAEKMSSAWLNFAKTSNPNADKVLPPWKPYSRENGETMIFDNECRIVNNHDRELMYLIKPID